MEYLVFARKWRPRNFEEVIGQDHVTKTLKGALAQGKLAHAYLFTGPQGVGKTSCARILAKSLNCERGDSAQPCSECSACREISEGRSLDVIEIDGASNRGIDEIRTLRENVKFAPLNGRSKIYIIDEVHMLTPEAFNALLKTLEEPPPFVKFIFATTQPQKVLSTILSRCQRFDFVRIPSSKIADKLKSVAGSEGLQISEEVFYAVARAADGCMRDALSIFDQLVSFSSGKVCLQDVVAVLGVIEQDIFLKFVDSVRVGDVASSLLMIHEISGQGKDMHTFLEGLLQHFRHLMVLSVIKAPTTEMIDEPIDVVKRLSEQAKAVTLEEVMASIGHIFAAQEMVRKIGAARIPLEVLSVKLAGVFARRQKHAAMKPGAAVIKKPMTEAGKVVFGFGASREKKAQPVASEAEQAKAEPQVLEESTATCGLEDVQSKWRELLDHLAQTKMSVSTYLKEAAPISVKGQVLTIGFAKTGVFFMEAMTHKDNTKILEAALARVLNVPLRAQYEIVAGLKVDDLAVDEAQAEAAPFLQSALDLFKGKVIKR